MRKLSICLLAAAALWCAGCDDNIPQIGSMDVAVTGVTIDDELRAGILLEVGQTFEAALHVRVEPADATDLAETFYSSDIEVATVDQKGVVTAQHAGIAMISIYVGGYEAYFAVEVVDQIPIEIETISFGQSVMEACVGVGYTLYVTTEPFDQNEGVVFTSSDPAIAKVDPATGWMECLQVGQVTITAAARNHPELKAELTVNIVEFFGDYDRKQWSMQVTSLYQGTSDQGSSLTAAIDGDPNTILLQVRPGKTWQGQSWPASDEISFTIDMKASYPVDYFRIHQRENPGSNPVRWYGFARIEGSNDGTSFEKICDFIEVPGADDASSDISPDVQLPRTVTYRYLRFVGGSGTDSPCYIGPSKGSTVQIKEFYLGRNKVD